MPIPNLEKHAYIFDLDGTLADVNHRRYLVEGETKHFEKFNKLCLADTLNKDVARIAFWIGSKADIYIFSGRSETVRDETEHGLGLHPIPYAELFMRAEGDYRPDDVIKKEMLVQCFGSVDVAVERVAGVFDDRDKVVKMWREVGITCFQVADGDF